MPAPQVRRAKLLVVADIVRLESVTTCLLSSQHLLIDLLLEAYRRLEFPVFVFEVQPGGLGANLTTVILSRAYFFGKWLLGVLSAQLQKA
jgi:hypothetical protein